MAEQVLTYSKYYTDIANAIREKTGTTQNYKPPDMAEAIKTITSGTADATATESDIVSPKTAYTANGKVTGTIEKRTAYELTAEGPVVSVPAGYYEVDASKSVATAEQAIPTVIVSNTGLITARATQQAGYVSEGTKTDTKQLPVREAQTIIPTTVNQVISSGTFLTGNLTIAGDSNLLPNNIRKDTVLFGITGTLEAGTPVQFYNISASVEPVGSGTVSGMGQCTAGMNVTLSAFSDDYTFVRWKSNDRTVSKNLNFNFDVSENVNLIAEFRDDSIGYLLFSSDSEFTLKTSNESINWDGTLPYSTDADTWSVWNGTTISSVSGKLYLRGTGNTKISGDPYAGSGYFVITGSNVSCIGNIEMLLDYESVASSIHPVMGTRCFNNLFTNCIALVSAPVLPAIELSYACYNAMFSGCSNLRNVPVLSATTLAYGCYERMFSRCTSLMELPVLPATTLENYCYNGMFTGFTNIKVSETQTDNEYKFPYRIPVSGTGAVGQYSLTDMFLQTGGTFAQTPQINKTYYTTNPPVE